MKFLFSVIIPAYNAQDTISSCIESVLKQEFDDYEIIVIDDGSTDSTAEKIKAINSTKIKYFHKENGGVSSARNLGLNKASGEWIIFLDADDTLAKDSLKKLEEATSKNDAGFIITPVESFKDIRTTRDQQKSTFYLDKTDAIDGLLFNLPSSTYFVPRCLGGKIVKRELVQKYNLSFDEKLKIFEDGIFNIFASYYAEKILFLNSSIYIYNRNNPNSRSNTFYSKVDNDNIIVYETIKNILEKLSYDSPSFPYLCLELFYNSSFAVSRENINTSQKIKKIRHLEKTYAKHFLNKIKLKEAYKTLKVVYILDQAKAYRLLLLFYKTLFKSLKKRNKV